MAVESLLRLAIASAGGCGWATRLKDKGRTVDAVEISGEERLALGILRDINGRNDSALWYMQMGADRLQRLKGLRRGEVQICATMSLIILVARPDRQICHVILATRFASRPASQKLFVDSYFNKLTANCSRHTRLP